MNNLISVIIPVYNSGKYLERCLNSLIAQTHENLEIIIINDGSKDNSAEIIEKFTSKDQRIIAVHQENQGVSAARNKGLEIAKGEFIGFVDADDEAEKDLYELLYHNLQKYEADISHCGFELVKPDETIKFHDSGIVLIQTKFDAIAEILSGQRIEPSTCNKLYKKSVLQNVFFPSDIKTNEDLLFNVEAFYNAEKSVFEDQVKYKYFSNSTSASHSVFTEKKAEDLYAVAKRIKEILKDEHIKGRADQFYAAKLLTILQALQTNHLQNSALAKTLRREISPLNVSEMGLRTQVLKMVLVKFPFLYPAFRFVYDLFFIKNQKWKNH